MPDPTGLAFVHDWLVTRGGGEQVLEAALDTLGPAPVHTLVYKPEIFFHSPISQQQIIPSFLQRLVLLSPGSRLPLVHLHSGSWTWGTSLRARGGLAPWLDPSGVGRGGEGQRLVAERDARYDGRGCFLSCSHNTGALPA